MTPTKAAQLLLVFPHLKKATLPFPKPSQTIKQPAQARPPSPLAGVYVSKEPSRLLPNEREGGGLALSRDSTPPPPTGTGAALLPR